MDNASQEFIPDAELHEEQAIRLKIVAIGGDKAILDMSKGYLRAIYDDFLAGNRSVIEVWDYREWDKYTRQFSKPYKQAINLANVVSMELIEG